MKDHVAFVAPKKTIFFDDNTLKLFPLIITEDPTGPFFGTNVLIMGPQIALL